MNNWKNIVEIYTSIYYIVIRARKEERLCNRKITDFLEQWKESEHRKPLILQGARQVGKTYSILEFGRTHYDNVAYFNFETNSKLNETFEENISPGYLIRFISYCRTDNSEREDAYSF